MVNICPGVMFLPVFHKDQSMIYLMVFSVAQNCLQMKPRYLQQHIILTMQRMIWIITWPKSRNGISNPDISKHAHEVIFSHKKSITSHSSCTYISNDLYLKTLAECFADFVVIVGFRL